MWFMTNDKWFIDKTRLNLCLKHMNLGSLHLHLSCVLWRIQGRLCMSVHVFEVQVCCVTHLSASSPVAFSSFFTHTHIHRERGREGERQKEREAFTYPATRHTLTLEWNACILAHKLARNTDLKGKNLILVKTNQIETLREWLRKGCFSSPLVHFKQ